MTSNTKLTQSEKDWFKAMLTLYPEIQFELIGQTTIAFEHKGDTVEFATALCHDAEKKNRTKVGKYFALARHIEGNTVKLKFQDFSNMMFAMHDRVY